MNRTFLKKINNKFLFNLFLLNKMPIAWISGLKIGEVSPERASVYIKFGVFNQNPFQSIYFACQAMAAEMTTGLLAMGYINLYSIKVSMLVIDFSASYSKKALGKIEFISNDGLKVKDAILKAVNTKKRVDCIIESKGIDMLGDCVSLFKITWSFKVKK